MNAVIQPHVVVVDDDPLMCDLISGYLRESDFRVSAAGSSTELDEILRNTVVDLILLDLRLPGRSGMQIAQELRRETEVPLIIVSGSRDEVDRVMCLEIAADDFITKPFSNRELLARTRAVLRRYHIRRHETSPARGRRRRAYRFGGWELNALGRKLLDPTGRQVPLSNGEFNLLLAFCESPRRVLSRDQLMDLSRLHGDEIYDRSMDVQIFRLLQKLLTSDASAAFIQTERGAGYIFAVDVEVSIDFQ